MDDDGKQPKYETAEPTGDAAEDEDDQLREASEADLKQILAAHNTSERLN